MIVAYNRARAVAYANRWAYFRNPAFYDFENIGGDCTNFASQCLYAGSGIMNFTPETGWFYRSPEDRTASWTGVEYFYDFLINNQGPGPFGEEVGIEELMPGDFVQINYDSDIFEHTPVVISVREPIGRDTVWVAAHSLDSNCRPLSSYDSTRERYIHILGVRTPE